MKHLDANPLVVTWTYESVIIPYVSNKKTGKLRKYFPDFFVTYAAGHKILVEIKPSRRVKQVKVAKKLEAAEAWCKASGVTLEVITEFELKQLGLI